MRMLELRRERNLPPKAIGTELRRDFGREDLDHNFPAELPVHCQEDATHPSAGELALEGVAVAERAFESRPEIRHELRPVFTAATWLSSSDAQGRKHSADRPRPCC